MNQRDGGWEGWGSGTGGLAVYKDVGSELGEENDPAMPWIGSD